MQTKITSSLKELYELRPNARFDIPWPILADSMDLREFVIRYDMLLDAYRKALRYFGFTEENNFQNTLEFSYYIGLYMPPSHWNIMMDFHKNIAPSLESLSFQYEDVMYGIHESFNHRLDDINAQLQEWEDSQRMHSSPSRSSPSPSQQQAPPLGVVRVSKRAENRRRETYEVPDTPSMPGSQGLVVSHVQPRSLGTDEGWRNDDESHIPPLAFRLIRERGMPPP